MPEDIPVTYHAIRRYFEHVRGRDFSGLVDKALVHYLSEVEGRDVEKIKEEINNPDVHKWVKKLGDGDYPIGGNKYYARVVDGVVVTTLPVKSNNSD